MNEFIASSTALATSLMRAVHTRLDPDPLIDDLWGDRLVPEWFREAFRQLVLAKMDSDPRAKALASPDSIVDAALRANAAYAGVIIRARYTEDALRAAVANGIRQYVIIGAGFDSFALRRPAFAREVDVYEIDHPATQGLKCQRLRECGLSIPGSVHFIEADLAEEDLGTTLARSPFRSNHPAFFSWLGVTVYLTREANLATLRAIATCGAPGSEMVFTYVNESEFNSDSDSGSFREVQTTAASVGERWVSGFDPTKIAEDLRRVGLILVEDLDGGQMAERYERTGVNILRPVATAHIARVRIPG